MPFAHVNYCQTGQTRQRRSKGKRQLPNWKLSILVAMMQAVRLCQGRPLHVSRLLRQSDLLKNEVQSVHEEWRRLAVRSDWWSLKAYSGQLEGDPSMTHDSWLKFGLRGWLVAVPTLTFLPSSCIAQLCIRSDLCSHVMFEPTWRSAPAIPNLQLADWLGYLQPATLSRLGIMKRDRGLTD